MERAPCRSVERKGLASSADVQPTAATATANGRKAGDAKAMKDIQTGVELNEEGRCVLGSETPRTDNMLGKLFEMGFDLHNGSCPEVLVTEMRKIELEMKAVVDQWTADRADMVADARKLQRQLTEATERANKMKEAGNRVAQLLACEAGYMDNEEWANAMREDQLRMIERADFDWAEASKVET